MHSLLQRRLAVPFTHACAGHVPNALWECRPPPNVENSRRSTVMKLRHTDGITRGVFNI